MDPYRQKTMSRFSGTVINSYVQTLIETACRYGADKAELLRFLDAEATGVEEPGKRIPIQLMTKLWMHIVSVTGDPDIGLHVGETVRPGSFHVLAPLVMNCDTLSDTIDVVVRYHRLVSEGGTISHRKTDRGLSILYTPGPFPIPLTRFQVECIFAGITTFSRWLINKELSPAAVSFTHGISHQANEYDRIFNCPVYFLAETNSIEICSEYLNMKIPHADPNLYEHHRTIAEDLLARHEKETRIVAEVTDILSETEDTFTMTLAEAAERLKLSPRVLQRRLKTSSASFHEIRTSVIMKKAHHLLVTTDLPVSMISETLGYDNTSSFHRRFKKWFGVPPLVYRRRTGGQ